VTDSFYNLTAIRFSSTASSKISLEKQMIKKFSSCYGSFTTVLAIPLVPTGASWTHSTLCTLLVIRLIWTFILVLPFVVTLLPHSCHILCLSRLPSICPFEQHSANFTNQDPPQYAPSTILLSLPFTFRYSYWHFYSEMHPTCVLPFT